VQTLDGAKEYADNIKDISPERIYDELKKILVSDKKYPFSDKKGHYTALKILDETRVLDRIFPELTLGRGMAQRKDFHNYDVLEHSLRCVLYSPSKIRLAALVHDIGKPYCMQKSGVYYGHDKEGAIIAEKVLRRLKADNESIKNAVFLTKEHMLDLDGKMRESKVKRYIARNGDKLEQLFMIKQADYSACKDDLALAPAVTKWKNIVKQMKVDGVPTSYKELKISPEELIKLGYKGKKIGEGMQMILYHAIDNPKENESEKLILFAKNLLESL
jgi:tRNA nucleotidyltransferase (CCA-adding enzyme)